LPSLFDVLAKIQHSARFMRQITSLMGLLALVSSCLAAETNRVETGTNGPVRPISLQESIQLALQHNLGLQIERLSPQIARFDLAGSYSYYDPVFTLRGEQSFNSSPGGFNPTLSIPTPPNDTWTEHFSAGFTGRTPSGMQYDLGSDLTRTSGTFPGGTNALGGFDIIDRGFQYRPNVGINITQPLLRDFWTDSARTGIKVNKKLIKIAEYGFEFQVMTIVNSVQQAYFDLIFARENVKVQEKALELAQRLLDENNKRVEIGTIAPLDARQAQSQRATALADLILAQNTYAGSANVLKSLLTDKYTEWHGIRLEPTENLLAIPESFNVAESWNKALKMRPDYNQLKEELERQNLILKFDYNQLFPSLDLVGSYGRNGLSGTLGSAVDQIGNGDFPRWSGGAVLTVPLWRNKERYQYKHDKAAQQQALLRLKKLEQDVIVQVDDTITRARSDYQRIQATREAREFAEAALQAEQTKLENGKSTSFVVLQLQSNLTKARSAEIQALADYQKSLSEFYFREGTTLERNKIMVNDK
jgi:outer membrane protein TolC